MIKYLPVLILLFTLHSSLAQTNHAPTFEEVLSLASVSNPQLSPDGTDVVFQVNRTDWKNNRYDTELWLSRDGNTPRPFSNNPENSSRNPKWSPDGEWIAYVSDKGDKNQIQLIRASGGESFQLTNTKNGVQNFNWSPDGSMIAYTQSEDQNDQQDARKDKYGGFEIEDEEYGKSQLWITRVTEEALVSYPLPDSSGTVSSDTRDDTLIPTNSLSVGNFLWSPDGNHIALQLQPNQNILSGMYGDIYIYTLTDSTLQLLVDHPGPDNLEAWSPDGNSILYGTSLSDTTSFFYTNGHMMRIDTDGTNDVELAGDFDEQLGIIRWTPKGIYALALQKTKRKLVRINENNGKTTLIESGPERIYQADISEDGERIAYLGGNDHDLGEVYIDYLPLSKSGRGESKLTRMSDQISSWAVSDSEVIQWTSEDGTTIEGILHKPEDYDPSRKYPLLVAIHGGPTGISVPSPTPSYVYPIVQWLNKGALVLQPNYRGSAGYGEEFRSLNVKNLGVGDAWDVESGVASLIEKDLVDPNKVGVMGWSQGGYISAYLTTTSDKFKAVSVGAGISNWMTYYVNTDIHPFTRQYLKATPWSDKEIYERTSPMTFINQAKTPTLIQHGEFDRRVPVPNAYELYQGLQDVGVETKLIIYKGFGHGITKPKERLAATWHNWQWFGKYIWGEDIEIPE